MQLIVWSHSGIIFMCDCRSLNPMFEGGLQHDCHEVMRCLLAYVENATKEVNKHRKRMKLLPGTINLNPPGEWTVRCHCDSWCGCRSRENLDVHFFQTGNFLWWQGKFVVLTIKEQFLAPANEVAGRYCFYTCLSLCSRGCIPACNGQGVDTRLGRHNP